MVFPFSLFRGPLSFLALQVEFKFVSWTRPDGFFSPPKSLPLYSRVSPFRVGTARGSSFFSPPLLADRVFRFGYFPFAVFSPGAFTPLPFSLAPLAQSDGVPLPGRGRYPRFLRSLPLLAEPFPGADIVTPRRFFFRLRTSRAMQRRSYFPLAFPRGLTGIFFYVPRFCPPVTKNCLRPFCYLFPSLPSSNDHIRRYASAPSSPLLSLFYAVSPTSFS